MAKEIMKNYVSRDFPGALGSDSCSVVFDSVTPWTMQSMDFSRPEYWSGAFPSSRGSSQPRGQIQVSHIAGGFFIS